MHSIENTTCTVERENLVAIKFGEIDFDIGDFFKICRWTQAVHHVHVSIHT